MLVESEAMRGALASAVSILALTIISFFAGSFAGIPATLIVVILAAMFGGVFAHLCFRRT